MLMNKLTSKELDGYKCKPRADPKPFEEIASVLKDPQHMEAFILGMPE